MNKQDIQEIINHFIIKGEVIDAHPFGNGHINDTYLVTIKDREEKYVLQRINTDIFKHPKELMQNVVYVTDYLRTIVEKRGGDTKREVVTVYPTIAGEYTVEYQQNHFRVMLCIEDGLSLDLADTPELFYQSARAFGAFQKDLTHFDASKLFPIIDKFHDTRDRLRQLEVAIAENKANRKHLVQEELDFIFAHKNDCFIIADGLDNGTLPLRVTHNDTKLNNVLLDKETNQPLCVLDLDTIMPGSSLYDFGDSIRFGASTALEDEPDVSKVHLSLELFDAYTKGFVEEAGDILTSQELALLPQGAKTITLEQGIRFLTDYLNGDTYFKTEYPEHNLVRTRTQLALVKEMDEKWQEMLAIVKQYS